VTSIIQVPSSQLCLGMYIVLPSSWLNHSFLRNKFLLKTENQLKKLKSGNHKFIDVDMKRSKLPPGWSLKEPLSERTITDHPHAQPPDIRDAPQDWKPETLVPEGLQVALHDKMEPEARSQAVYSHSRELMSRLLESPTAENLKASKRAIGSITDLILRDDQTASNMLRITSHDFYTYTHSVNVGVFSIMLAKALFAGSDAHDMHELGAGFFLHDLGKVNIRSEIINKPGKLTDDEMRHMRTHPYKGYKILDACDQLSEECRIIILQHHERADGKGYPRKLGGDEIHPYGTICCIADVFDALTSERSYKKSMTPFEALTLMKNSMSDNFDTVMFEKFVRLMG